MRKFRLISVVATAFFALSCGEATQYDPYKEVEYPTPNTEEVDTSHYPEFSWDVVPTSQHLCAQSRHFSEEEAQIIAKSAVTCIELQQATRLEPKKYTVENTDIAARQIKQYNAKAKVIFYWHSMKDLGGYYQAEGKFVNPKAEPTVNADWTLYKANGELYPNNDVSEYHFDMTNYEVMLWWSNFAIDAINKTSIDGFFADGVNLYYVGDNQTKFGEQKAKSMSSNLNKAFTRIKNARKNGSITLANVLNGYTPQREWAEDILPYVDGIMIEHFAALSGTDKDKIVGDIEKIQECAERQKIVIVKGFPRFTFLDAQNPTSEYYYTTEKKAELDQICYDDIEFPLACFLVAAGRYSYFQYSWGYDVFSGNLLDYPEFKHPLGEPLGDATKDGYEYRREFEHASVWVNLETREAIIDWDKAE